MLGQDNLGVLVVLNTTMYNINKMSDINKNILQKELDFYNKNKAKYLETYKEQFVLIKGEKLMNSFTTEEEAYKAGVAKFGNEPFLIKKVVEEEQIESIPALTAGVIHVGV